MSWNDLFPNDIDLRSASGSGLTGSNQSTQKTGYYHLRGRNQEADETVRRSDTFRVWYFWSIENVVALKSAISAYSAIDRYQARKVQVVALLAPSEVISASCRAR